MEIEILDFIPEDKGLRKGFVDFKVSHGNGKFEIFRNIVYFEKGDRKWLDIGNVYRNGKWVKRYDREPPINNILNATLKELHKKIEL